MGGLRRVTLSEAMEILQDKNMEFIFTFHNNRTWSFETLDCWMKYNKVARPIER